MFVYVCTEFQETVWPFENGLGCKDRTRLDVALPISLSYSCLHSPPCQCPSAPATTTSTEICSSADWLLEKERRTSTSTESFFNIFLCNMR